MHYFENYSFDFPFLYKLKTKWLTIMPARFEICGSLEGHVRYVCRARWPFLANLGTEDRFSMHRAIEDGFSMHEDPYPLPSQREKNGERNFEPDNQALRTLSKDVKMPDHPCISLRYSRWSPSLWPPCRQWLTFNIDRTNAADAVKMLSPSKNCPTDLRSRSPPSRSATLPSFPKFLNFQLTFTKKKFKRSENQKEKRSYWL